MKYKSFCKVNLMLLINKFSEQQKLHKIYSIFYKVESLYDEIEISINNIKDEIKYIDSKEKEIKIDDCIISKTLFLLRENKTLNKNLFFTIKVIKNIPLFSGLGGGSSNAATLIKYLLDNNHIKKSKNLNKIILSIGSDVMFFVKEYQTALVYGFGNKIKKLKSKKNLEVELVLTNFKCDTKKVFSNFKENNYYKQHSLIKQLLYFKINKYNLLVNELEKSCFSVYPEMERFAQNFDKNKKLYLSGTGSTFFVINKKE